jgi:hypothetical protein
LYHCTAKTTGCPVPKFCDLACQSVTSSTAVVYTLPLKSSVEFVAAASGVCLSIHYLKYFYYFYSEIF